MSKYIYNCSLARLPGHKLKMGVHISPDNLPASHSLRSKFHFVYDQGRLGSCTGNALCGLVRFRTPDFNPSRLFLYYNERNIEGTESTDSGAMLSDGVKSLQQQGVCSELAWPYNIEKFAERPPSPCYKLAQDHIFHKGYNIDNTDIQQIKASLYQGNPFVMGIAVYESFESREVAQTGEVPMPGPDEKLLGGHAILCCGYDDQTQRVTCLNSWGDWGDHGFFTLPYVFVTNANMTSDAWTIGV